MVPDPFFFVELACPVGGDGQSGNKDQAMGITEDESSLEKVLWI
jgi:hypothetical protein